MSAVSPRSRFGLYLDLIRWDRPAGWLVCLWPTLSALWIAAEGFPGWHLLAVFVLGTILMRSAGCAINDWADRDFDRHVERTRDRPLTAGLIQAWEAVAVFVVLIFFCLQLITGLIRRDPSALSRAALGLARSVLGSFLVLTLTITLLEVVDQLTIGVIQATGTTLEEIRQFEKIMRKPRLR